MKQYRIKTSKGYSKYHNNKIWTSYGEFDSAKEHQRFLLLQSMERSGKISDLKRQVPFVLLPTQKGKLRTEHPIKYIADFVYMKDGVMVVEDTKGYRTREYVMKRKLMLFIHGIEIVEV